MIRTILDIKDPTTDDIVDLIIEYGEEIAQCESLMNSAVLFLETQGTTVDKVLAKRERKKQNDKT